MNFFYNFFIILYTAALTPPPTHRLMVKFVVAEDSLEVEVCGGLKDFLQGRQSVLVTLLQEQMGVPLLLQGNWFCKGEDCSQV